ncbi:MAG: GMC family oxidoreductase [Deltaproteobacteria bacterium]|nr:GMC family oxidoreductase [Deltaproteobacteria bacterium]
MHLDGSKLKTHADVSCDVAIIGTGAGGAVLGKELAERGLSVVFCEEGAWHAPASHRDLASQATARLYRDHAMTVAFGTPLIPVPMGKAVGGTTVVNSGTCLRPRPETHERWARGHGLEGLEYEELVPHYEHVEKELGVREADPRVISRSNLVFGKILEREGFRVKPLARNAPDCRGCGMCCYGCTSGAKRSMEVSYIPKALSAGARLYSSCRAKKIIMKGMRAIGVEGVFLSETGHRTGQRLRVRADLVVLAAGALHTPALLMANGLVQSPQVGRNLILHPASKVFAEFDTEIDGWNGIPQGLSVEALREEGIVFEGAFLPPDLGAVMNPLRGREVHAFMRRYRFTAVFGFMIRDSAAGRIMRIPFVGPVMRYDLSPIDARKMKKAALLLAEACLEHGARRVIPMIHGPVKEFRGRVDLDAFRAGRISPRDVEAAAFHPLCTARMGRNPGEGVVDSNGKVFGCEGLYVCDGSALPSSPGVNPQLVIMALARRMAHQNNF